MGNRLNETEIREILKRAEQIHVGATLHQEEDTESKALIKAAEEAGLPREAVEQALRERLEATTLTTEPGEFIFAPSADGKLYVAEFIRSESGRTTAKYLNGGEATFDSDLAHAATFQPGSKVQANWPNYGWWPCTVIGFDKPNRLLRLTDGWGTEKSFPLAEIRRIPPKKNASGLNAKVFDFWDRNKMYIIVAAGLVFLGLMMRYG